MMGIRACLVLIALASAWAGPMPYELQITQSEAEVIPYGIVDTTVDMVKNMLESAVNIADKIGELSDKVEAIIDQITGFLDGLEDGTPDGVINEVFNRAISQILRVLDVFFAQIDNVFMAVVKYADEEIGDMWGASLAKKALDKVVEKFYDVYIEKVIGAIEKLTDKVQFSSAKLQSHWDNFMGKLVDALEEMLQANRDTFLQDLKQRSISLLKIKRDAKSLDELVDAENPANDLDGSEYKEITLFGLVSDLKSVLLKVKEVVTQAKLKVEGVMDLVDYYIDFYKNLKNGFIESEMDPAELVSDVIKFHIRDHVLGLIDTVVEQVTTVIQGVIETVDSLVSDILQPIKEKIFKWLDDVIVSVIETVMTGLQKVLNRLNQIEGSDWDGIVDYILDSAQQRLDDAFEDLRKLIKDKISEIGK